MNSKKTNKNNRLGRGLSSLLGDENEKINNESKNGLRKEIQNKNEIIDIPIEWINPNPLQPRKIFEKDLLEELAKSIMEKGIFQPLLKKDFLKKLVLLFLQHLKYQLEV